MPDKPQTSAVPCNAPFLALPDHAIVTLSGRDAAAFAQAQFMNDVAALAEGHWQWNGWLTPKGRVIALFALLKLDAERLWLLLPDMPADAFAQQLRRFVFRSKVAIAHRPDLQASGALAASALASGSHFVGDADSGIELDSSGDGSGRTLRIGATGTAEDAEFLRCWRLQDLRHGLPRLDESQRDAWTPQQLSLDRLRAYSVKKGCYPGQEIVARTHFLGQAKRGLMRLRGAGVGASDEVFVDGASVGRIVCATEEEGLAVMPVQPPSGAMSTGGVPCERLPLLDGLAR